VSGTLTCSSPGVFNTSACVSTIPQQHYVSKWSGYGAARDVDVDTSGNVYVVDQFNNQLDITDANGVHIAYITGLNGPEGVCVSKTDGTIAITEQGISAVKLYNSVRVFIRSIGSAGDGNGQFFYPAGCAFDSSNNLYVADDTDLVGDTIHHRVEVFDINGNYLRGWGSKGTGNGQFNRPSGLIVDSDSNVYVVDGGNNRVQKFSSIGTYIGQWGGTGTGDGKFSFPSYIGIDSSNNLYVMDSGNDRVEVFSATGVFLYALGSSGLGDGQFADPIGIAVTSGGVVYGSDFTRNDVQKFTF